MEATGTTGWTQLKVEMTAPGKKFLTNKHTGMCTCNGRGEQRMELPPNSWRILYIVTCNRLLLLMHLHTPERTHARAHYTHHNSTSTQPHHMTRNTTTRSIRDTQHALRCSSPPHVYTHIHAHTHTRIHHTAHHAPHAHKLAIATPLPSLLVLFSLF